MLGGCSDSILFGQIAPTSGQTVECWFPLTLASWESIFTVSICFYITPNCKYSWHPTKLALMFLCLTAEVQASRRIQFSLELWQLCECLILNVQIPLFILIWEGNGVPKEIGSRGMSGALISTLPCFEFAHASWSSILRGAIKWHKHYFFFASLSFPFLFKNLIFLLSLIFVILVLTFN